MGGSGPTSKTPAEKIVGQGPGEAEAHLHSTLAPTARTGIVSLAPALLVHLREAEIYGTDMRLVSEG